MADLKKLEEIKNELAAYQAGLVAVSKLKSTEEIQEVFNAGQIDFGENYVQEMVTKQSVLDKSIRWHFIGHLQRNKVKNILPIVTLIHGVDSRKLLEEINIQSEKTSTVTQCLLQLHIAEEESKFGLSEKEADDLLDAVSQYTSVRIMGLMGMATLTDDSRQIEKEFKGLWQFYDKHKLQSGLSVLSMGMTSDYKIALACGSNLVRIGSAIFGERKRN